MNIKKKGRDYAAKNESLYEKKSTKTERFSKKNGCKETKTKKNIL